MKIQYYHSCVSNTQAAVAQSVVRRIGSAEVTGSIPVSSFFCAQKYQKYENYSASYNMLWYNYYALLWYGLHNLQEHTHEKI